MKNKLPIYGPQNLPLIPWFKKGTLRAIWRWAKDNIWYRLRHKDHFSGGYCYRCMSCGVEECCPPSVCDRGLLCAKFYE